jgi:hypothetical protein
MCIDPHERAAIEKRIAELDARLDELARVSVAERVAKSVKIQLEMGELLRTIAADDSPS